VEVDLGTCANAQLCPAPGWRSTGTWLVSLMKIEWLALLNRLGFDRCDLVQPAEPSGSRCKGHIGKGGPRKVAKSATGSASCTSSGKTTGQGCEFFISLPSFFLFASLDRLAWRALISALPLLHDRWAIDPPGTGRIEAGAEWKTGAA